MQHYVGIIIKIRIIVIIIVLTVKIFRDHYATALHVNPHHFPHYYCSKSSRSDHNLYAMILIYSLFFFFCFLFPVFFFSLQKLNLRFITCLFLHSLSKHPKFSKSVSLHYCAEPNQLPVNQNIIAAPIYLQRLIVLIVPDLIIPLSTDSNRSVPATRN